MAKTPPDLLVDTPDLLVDTPDLFMDIPGDQLAPAEPAPLHHPDLGWPAGAGRDINEPQAPPRLSLSPIAERAWSLASEAADRLDFVDQASGYWCLCAAAEGADVEYLKIYRAEAARVCQNWRWLLDEFRVYADVEPSLRPFDNAAEEAFALKVLSFRKLLFYNRYRMVFERLDMKSTIADTSDFDRAVARMVPYWRSVQESITEAWEAYKHHVSRSNRQGTRVGVLPEPAPCSAWITVWSACNRLGINFRETMDAILDFGSIGMLPPDILCHIEHGRVDLVRREVLSDIRTFPFIYYPSRIDYNRRVMIAKTLLRILHRWSLPTPNGAEVTSQYSEDNKRLNSGGAIGRHMARMQIADEIATDFREWESAARMDGIFVNLLYKQLLIVQRVETRDEYRIRWLRKNAERNVRMSAELRMMIDLIHGDRKMEKSQFDSYGEHRRPLASLCGGSLADPSESEKEGADVAPNEFVF
ncbi:hypothetical protein FQN49_000188 [Arthroderma sp. PD_2]|nr:hypothetical protein FQN49_000188 [Arthroderma sp. PD_2]